MKCEIIRDLLPSYIDGLTSEESNQAIEEHLEGCRECRRYLEEMRKEIVTDKLAKDEIEKRKKEIQPGDEEWEKLGIARYVTWPRTVCSITGWTTL